MILHDVQGYDEISLTGPLKVFGNDGEKIFEPGDLGLPQIEADEIKGGSTVEVSAKIFLRILEGRGPKLKIMW